MLVRGPSNDHVPPPPPPTPPSLFQHLRFAVGRSCASTDRLSNRSLTAPRKLFADRGQITTAAGCTFGLVFYPKFRTSSWRPYRAAAFAVLGLTAVAPVTNGLWLYGFDQMCKQIGLPWLVTQGLLYLLGALIYAVSFLNHIQQRLNPDFPLG